MVPISMAMKTQRRPRVTIRLASRVAAVAAGRPVTAYQRIIGSGRVRWVTA